MGFSGDLGDIGLNDVFQNIASNQLTGTLLISNDRCNLYIYFRSGKLSMASSVSNNDAQNVSAFSSREAQAKLKKNRSRKAIRALLKGQDEESVAFRAAVRESICEEVYEAFSWTDTWFNFEEGEPPDSFFPLEQLEAGIAMDTGPILMEAARRSDEWNRIHRQIRSLDEVFAPVSGLINVSPEDEVEARVLEHVDGRSDIHTIIARMSQSRFSVCKAISSLLRDRWIRPLNVQELGHLAVSLDQEGDRIRAMQILNSALEQERNDPTIHEHIGELQAKSGRMEDAARAFNLASSAYASMNRDREALSALKMAVSAAPGDVGMRERLLAMFLERQEADEALEQGYELAAVYWEMGLLDKARSTYLRLGTLAPDDPFLLGELARCERDLGNIRDALRLFKTAAVNAIKYGEANWGKRCLGEILAIQPDQEDAKKLLAQMEKGVTTVRKERLSNTRQLIFWGLGAMVLAYVIGYEAMARSRLHEIKTHNSSCIAEGRFIEAIDSYDTLRDSYPLSLARMEVGYLIEELARSLISAIENNPKVKDHASAIDSLEKVLALAVAPDVYKRARKQINRLSIEKKVLEDVSALSVPGLHDRAKAAIESLNDPNALSILERLLNHKNPEVRHLALRPLTVMKSFRTIPQIIELLKDKDSRVRTQALNTLLILTQHTTRIPRYQYWIDWWRAHGQRKFKNLGR